MSSSACDRCGFGNPVRGQPESRLSRQRTAGDRTGCRAIVHCQVLLGIGNAFGDRLSFYLHHVVVGADLHVVANADRRHDDSQIDGNLSANHADSVQQIAALGRIDHFHKSVPDLQFHRVQVEKLFNLFRLLLGGLLARLFRDSDRGFLLIPGQGPGQSAATGTEDHQRHLRHAGKHHEHEKSRGDDQRLGPGEELTQHFVAEVSLAAGTGDDQPCAQRYHECGNLAGQPIADRQLRVELHAVHEPPVLLHHADVKAAENIDERDDDAGNGVPADEFTGTVHRPVKIRLPSDVFPPLSRLRLGDDAGVHLRVDRHLLAGHRIEGESRRHFRDSAGAFGDDDKLNDEDDDENDNAHRQRTAGDELAEGVDNFAGGMERGFGVAGGRENQPGGRDIQHEPEERDAQEQRRKDGKFQRALYVNRRDQDDHRKRDVAHQEQVQHELSATEPGSRAAAR